MAIRELLNLAPIFEAIYEENNLTRAAERLGVSQPAISQSLSRLRNLVDDPLFVSTGRGVRPTSRATKLLKHIRTAVSELSAAVADRAFDASLIDRTFVLDIGAGFDTYIIPRICPEIARQAPNARLLVSNERGRELATELKCGYTELAFDFMMCAGDDMRSVEFGRAPAVVIARKEHPALANGLTREGYLNMSHVAVVWQRSPAASAVALELERHGVQLKQALSVPNVSTLGATVEVSDLIATTSSPIADELARRYRVDIFPMPLEFPEMPLYMIWHARFDRDQEHSWLRQIIVDAVKVTRRDSRPSSAQHHDRDPLLVHGLG